MPAPPVPSTGISASPGQAFAGIRRSRTTVTGTRSQPIRGSPSRYARSASTQQLPWQSEVRLGRTAAVQDSGSIPNATRVEGRASSPPTRQRRESPRRPDPQNRVTSCPGSYRSRIPANRSAGAHMVAVRPSRHVAVRQGIGRHRASGRESRRGLRAPRPRMPASIWAHEWRTSGEGLDTLGGVGRSCCGCRPAQCDSETNTRCLDELGISSGRFIPGNGGPGITPTCDDHPWMLRQLDEIPAEPQQLSSVVLCYRQPIRR